MGLAVLTLQERPPTGRGACSSCHAPFSMRMLGLRWCVIGWMGL